MSGPLEGLRIAEFAGVGPGPFAGMVLADLGADVIRIDRAPADGNADRPVSRDPTLRNRRSIALDLKHPDGVDVARRILDRCDGLIEGYRPGVMEAFGLGPAECLQGNPKLVYGRMTGWGQDGPLAQTAGHDINYISIAGVLAHIGYSDRPPVVPLNLVGDYGGGGMLLVVGMLAALLEARSSGRGQIVDAAMVDGAAMLMASLFGSAAAGHWSNERGTNLLDGGAAFYGTYETKDGKHISIGAVEKRFHSELAKIIGLPIAAVEERMKRGQWAEQRELVQECFKRKTRVEWCELLDGTDSCFAPVLTMEEALDHPHNVERATFVEVDGVHQPSPAPRFSRTPSSVRNGPVRPGAHSAQVLAEAGFTAAEIDRLRSDSTVV
jgi:alpha-methylacyl-CoA racemase